MHIKDSIHCELAGDDFVLLEIFFASNDFLVSDDGSTNPD
jgi:hypothetical protein